MSMMNTTNADKLLMLKFRLKRALNAMEHLQGPGIDPPPDGEEALHDAYKSAGSDSIGQVMQRNHLSGLKLYLADAVELAAGINLPSPSKDGCG